jgi:diaminopimelate epimerase
MARDFDSERPSLAGGWYKAHGLGNDYLVFEQGDGWRADRAAIARVCHRGEGVGSDGIVVVLPKPIGKPVPLRMFNPDGSEFERSGNGLRVLAAYLHFSGRVGSTPFDVESGGDRIRMQVHGRTPDGRYDVEVEMGRARVGPAAVELDPAALDGKGRISDPELGTIPFVPVSVGNPHAVVFADDLGGPFERATLDRIGLGLATHPSFAHGTNVQLVRAVPPDALDILIWERGVGPTTASGTSACATAVAAVSQGRLQPGDIEVRMEGGSFRVRVTTELDVVLRGPVDEVGTGELSEGFLHALADGRGRR